MTEITIDSASRQEIQSALASGKEVTVHQKPINEFGWTGSGYVVIDPETGAGGYKISGGANGGAITDLASLFGWVSAAENSYFAKHLPSLFGSLISTIIIVFNLLDIAQKCASVDGVWTVIFSYLLMTILVAFFIFVFETAFGAMAGFIAGFTLNKLQNLGMSNLMNNKGC